MQIPDKTKHTKLDRQQYWLIRAYYFLFLGAFSCLSPFLGLFYRRQGLSGTQIGLLGTIGAVISLLTAPFWARLSDRLTHPRRLLQGAFLGSAIGYLVLSSQDSFTRMALLSGLVALLLSGVEPVSDAMAIKSGSSLERTRFGSIRLWGSLGWAVVVFFAGWLVEIRGIGSAFWAYAGFILLTVLVAQFLQPPSKADNKVKDAQTASPKVVLQSVIHDRGLVGLGLSLAVIVFVRTGLHQFQAIYMDQLGAGESFIGLVSMVSGLVELPSMLLADRIASRLGSHRLLAMGFLGFAFTAGVIVLLPQVPIFLLSGAFSGVAFSFYNVALVVFVDERAPLGQTATVLALFTATLRGLINILAAPFSGLVFDRYGAYWLYVAALVGALAAWLLFRGLVSGDRSEFRIKDPQ